MSSSANHDDVPRRVLVTGASRGIGHAIARALLAEGAQLAVVGRDRAALAALVGSGAHVVITADLALEREADAAVDQAIQGLGGLDAMVAAAGIVEYAAVGTITRASLERQLAVNLIAPFSMSQRVAPELARAGGGSILLIASTLACKPARLSAAYAASKAALCSMTRSFALELGSQGIRVNAIAPGVVETDMIRVVRAEPGEAVPSFGLAQRRIEAQLSELRALHPLRRLGQAQDIAETALYLLRARYVTGTVVNVDGGLLLGGGEP